VPAVLLQVVFLLMGALGVTLIWWALEREKANQTPVIPPDRRPELPNQMKNSEWPDLYDPPNQVGKSN
jgi:hypothetical protein